MTVLHVTAPGTHGGLERVVGTLVPGLHACGEPAGAVLLLGLHDPAPPLATVLEAGGVPCEILRTRGRDYYSEWNGVRRAIMALGARLIHTHGYRADVVAGAAGRKHRVPVVSTAHGFTGGRVRNRFYEWLQVRAWRGCDTVVAVSRPLGDALVRRGVSPDRVHVIPNAWNGVEPRLSREQARDRLGLSPGKFVVGWVGRLSPEKGVEAAVAALRSLDEPEVILAIVGSGAERGRLEPLGERLGVAGQLRWVGPRDDAPDLFPAFDAFLLSSLTEGTPIVLFEAMAARVPIIATSVGGVPDVLGGDGGVLVPPGDPPAIANAIRRVMHDPGEAGQRVEVARRRLEADFTPDGWVHSYATLYHRLRTGSRPS